jgi:hypothetical protein
MKAILLTLISIIVFCLPAPASAAGIKGGRAACLSKDAFDEIMIAAARKDKPGFKHMLESGQCVISKAGLKVSIMETSFLEGFAKVRAYFEGRGITFWTSLENIELED